jgi:ribonuclease P/MRP protein subunit RPP40
LRKGVESGQEFIEEVQRVSASQQFTNRLEALMPFAELEKAHEALKHLEGLPVVRSYAVKMSPLLLFDPVFVTSYLKRGRLLLMSAGRLEDEDVFCIDSKAQLTLSLTRDTYQRLGLQGQAYKRAQTSSGRGGDRLSGRSERFVVSIDLLAPSFEPGRPGYERVRARIKAWDVARGDPNSDGSWDVVLNWTSGSDSFGETLQIPSSHAHLSTFRELSSSCEIVVLEDIWVPEDSCFAALSRGWSQGEKDETTMSWPEWMDELGKFTEYTSLLSIASQDVRTFSRPDELNTYEVPNPRKAGGCVLLRYVGFLPSTLAGRLAKQAHDFTLGTGTRISQMRSTSFADAPVIWKSQQEEVSIPEATSTSDRQYRDDDVGVRARRKRNARRQKRGCTNADQLGHQVRSAQSRISVGGWLVCNLGAAHSGSLVTLRDVGDSAVS